jgi:hypothetical protein
MSAVRKRIEEAQNDEATTQMLLEIRKHIVEETVSMNPAFDFEGLDEEVAQALLDLSYYDALNEVHAAESQSICLDEGVGMRRRP